jgi:Bacterial Ig-like domain
MFLITSCAKRGSIDGGRKDTLAPVLRVSFPKNFSTNFKEKMIKLTFDEYVKLKDINKQLIVSPPMKYAPDISPTSASKYISIKIKDTLLANTTYSFNFGQSIEDNNEGNPYKQFKYVFSTGTYIDSLKLRGSIKDAIDQKTDNFVSLILYDINEKYSDSIIYKQQPRYITNTLDSLKTFEIENLKAGKYLLVALKDGNKNNKYDPKTEKIGFQKQFVTIPNDTLFELELFKEKQVFKTNKPTQASGNRALLGFEGKSKNTKIEIKNGTEIIPNIVTRFPEKDSLQIWFKTNKMDSVSVKVTDDKYVENYILKLKKQKSDTLSFTPKQSGVLPLREKFVLRSSIPLLKIDDSKIAILNKDSVAIKFKTLNDSFEQHVIIDFKSEPLEKYKVKVLPGAFTDFFEKQNDTLMYKLETKNTSEYGNLRVKLENVKSFPVIVELTNKEGKILYSEYAEKANQVAFDLIDPALYTLRIIYDDNKNKEWDPGNFLEKRQSEEVIYYPKEIDIRQNWDVEQVFDLKR